MDDKVSIGSGNVKKKLLDIIRLHTQFSLTTIQISKVRKNIKSAKMAATDMEFLSDLCKAITPEDIKEIMPEGLVNGEALWARVAGPIGKDEFMKMMRQRPAKGTHARAGWMCGAALVIKANLQKSNARNTTVNMEKHLDVFKLHLDAYARCIMSNEAREKVTISKDPVDVYDIQLPTEFADEIFKSWADSKWPMADDGTKIPGGRQWIRIK